LSRSLFRTGQSEFAFFYLRNFQSLEMTEWQIFNDWKLADLPHQENVRRAAGAMRGCQTSRAGV
jgi:hypothetical protein